MYLTPEELERKFYIENNPLYYQLVSLIDEREEQKEEESQSRYNEGYEDGYLQGWAEIARVADARLTK